MSHERWSLLDLFEMGDAAASLVAAHRTGLLGALLARDDRPEGFATALGLDARATRLVLNILWAYGVVELNGERFRASAELARLYRDHPGAVGTDLDLFDYVADFLRSGAPLLRVDGSESERDDSFAQVAPRLGPRHEAAAHELALLLAAELGSDRAAQRVLDVGAGSGVWGLALVEVLPAARLTAVELPQVAELLRRRVANRGDAERVEVIAGGYFDVTLPPASAHSSRLRSQCPRLWARGARPSRQSPAPPLAPSAEPSPTLPRVSAQSASAPGWVPSSCSPRSS